MTWGGAALLANWPPYVIQTNENPLKSAKYWFRWHGQDTDACPFDLNRHKFNNSLWQKKNIGNHKFHVLEVRSWTTGLAVVSTLNVFSLWRTLSFHLSITSTASFIKITKPLRATLSHVVLHLRIANRWFQFAPCEISIFWKLQIVGYPRS